MLRSFIVPAALFIGFAASCSKKNETQPAPPPAQAFPISAAIDDQSWGSENYDATLEGKRLTISCYSPDLNSSMTLVSFGAELDKEYDMLPGTGCSGTYGYGTHSYSTLDFSQSGGYTGSGKIRITKLDLVSQTVSGTFGFTGIETKGRQETKMIKNGIFTNLSYRVLPFHPPGQVFKAKINGTAFSPDTLRLTNSSTGSGLQIDAKTSKSKFVLNLKDNTPGTYSNSPDYTVQYQESVTFSCSSVVITISSYDEIIKELKGTFSFKATDGTAVKTITEGSFDIYR